MPRRDRISIQWKVFLYLIGFCILLLVVLWLLQIVFLNDFYKTIKTKEMQQTTQSIAKHIQQGNWEQITKEVSVQGDLTVELWEPNFGTLMLVGKLYNGAQITLNHWDKQTLMALTKQNGGSMARRYTGTRGLIWDQTVQESILYTSILTAANGEEQLLMVGANISPMDATVQTLRYQLYVISGIMLVLAVGLALIITKRVSRPIEALNRSAAQLAAGNYDVAFREGGYREIAQLSDTLDHAARELSKTEHLRRELIANVSHDLRTPLTLITGYGEMIRDLPGENTPENMQVIIDESKRLTTLVNNMLDLSVLQSGAKEINLQPCNITQQTQEIVHRIAQFCQKDGYQVVFAAHRPVWVQADIHRISQVLYNLLTNGITYTGKDKRVLVSQTVQDGRVTIAVEDSGEGIAQQDLPYVWERYYKVDTVHKRPVAGTGLGLSIVKSILQQHPHVDYGVRSTLGVGSVFWFSMPEIPPEL